MKCTKAQFEQFILDTGAPVTELKTLPQQANALARWFFVRQFQEGLITRAVREYLLELDTLGFVRFDQK